MAAFASRLSTIALTLLAALGLMLVSAEARAAGTSLVVNRLQIVDASGPASANCQALLDTLSGITDAGEDRRYTLRLEPGTYDCGETAVVMKSFVDLEGSGEEATLIIGDNPAGPTLVGKVNSEVRHVTIEHRGGVDVAFAVANAESARYSHVTLKASGGTITAMGCYNSSDSNPVYNDVLIEVDCVDCQNVYGMATLTSAPLFDNVRIRVNGGTELAVGIDSATNDFGAPFSPLVIRNVDIEVSSVSVPHGISIGNVFDPPAQVLGSRVWVKALGSNGRGILNSGSDIIIANTFIEVDFFQDPTAAAGPSAERLGSSLHGIHNDGSSGSFEVRVDNSQIRALDKTVRNDSAFTTRIGGSLLSGGDVDDSLGGLVICAGVWDENTVFYPAKCPGQPDPP